MVTYTTKINVKGGVYEGDLKLANPVMRGGAVSPRRPGESRDEFVAEACPPLEAPFN